jgi:glycosyltransferase involved in cell wall biosynthesis
MKVLMFGWEFPPFISGGLGTACHGITNGLLHNNVGLSFVMPTKRGKNLDTPLNIIAADEVPYIKKYQQVVKRTKKTVSLESQSIYSITPYYTTEVYNEFWHKFLKINENTNMLEDYHGVLQFSGNYGHNLMDEVNRYGFVGEVLGHADDFDIIHAHDWLTYIAGVAAKTSSGKPLVIHVHATEFDRSGENINQTVYDIERYGMDNADKIIAVSYYTKNIIVNRYGIHPDKVEVVHNAVNKQRNIEQLNIKSHLNEKIVLFLGRITMQKGPDYFIEAAHQVYKKVKNVRFVMAGSGDMLPRMILRMSALRMLDRFHFTGFLQGLDVERMYSLSDIYVMPSVSEPFGIAPFEALLYDVPIIISRQSGVAEVLNNAIKIDFWDVNKMADWMIKLLQDDKLARHIVESSQQDLETVGWDSAGFKIKEIYQSVINNSK